MADAIELISGVGAMLLDMDGTLVNSNAAVDRAWTAWAKQNGADPKEVLAFCHGQPSRATVRKFAPHLNDEQVEESVKAHIAFEVSDTEGTEPMPDAVELVGWLDGRGIDWAVVTNSPAELAARRLTETGLNPRVLVTASDVVSPKPAPDPYQYAAELLGIPPENCAAVEDSPAGLQSGREAGCLTVAIGMSAHDTDADIVCENLSDLLALLQEAFD